MRVLLVEDDEDLSGRIAAVLRSENFVVDIARNGEDALHAGLTELFDVAILDLGLPKIDGVSVLKGWREGDRNLPVLVLTARDGWPDKVSSFKAGADDFLAKPFKVEELVLRLRALVRRAAGHAASRLVCGALTFDAQLGTFELDGLPLKLTALEWRVLSCLMLRKEMIVDRRELTERVYDGDAEVDSNSIEVIIARLRKKLGGERIETMRGRIETVRGRGYMLTAAS
ncbi:response regulator transcription factor [Rhizobium leguminosarum]|uniref:Response regulator transcription factor n=1 Tax=Rhizobium leguminosarum TaxID=384 RepID=A0A4Q8Y056_RHILE|nr:response regulator transcription factor [Rhizobium leguminosarum]TAU89485.1 response regulator transcription factor [Rhizobium leguminosarum]TAV54138.1 response regulator transcription factor [Rhizobium leguminosarum]TAV90137.1 response regulator transcription factor [Rhizobium leguminosarum]TAV94745.1 response regulator transcription factor [Rhizobium leguminosarum]TAW35821.1 response regulator transcription factor [Rhizobium leguminosarum]